jgi:hypothetical protein
MREDLRSALEKDNIAADRLSEARFQYIEEYVPANSKILCAVGGGMFLLLNTGILVLATKNPFKGTVKGAELVPFSHLGKVSVEKRGMGSGTHYEVCIHRNNANAGILAGASSPLTKLVGASTFSRENADNFHKLLLDMMANPGGNSQSPDDSLEKIGQLKKLLDSGAITQDEFDEKKKKLMDSI